MSTAIVRRNNNAILEDVEVIFQNFAGVAKEPYNPEGDRNFCIILSEEKAEEFLDFGYNVKRLKPRENQGEMEGRPYLKVIVSFRFKQPNIVLITSEGRNALDEELCGMLDWVDMECVDVIINPSFWKKSGRSGVSAYLQTIFVTAHEDELVEKYKHIKEVGYESRLAIESGQTPGTVEGEVLYDSDDYEQDDEE